MLGLLVSLVLLVVSIAIARLIYRRIYYRQIERGEEGNIFVALMILAATCLVLGFAYTGIEIGTGVDLPGPVVVDPIHCEDGSIRRIDGSCPCSQFDLRVRCP